MVEHVSAFVDVGHRTALLVLNFADAIFLVLVLALGHGAAATMKPHCVVPSDVFDKMPQ
jgi:hypothetical protein